MLHQVFNKPTLLTVIALNLLLTACGGGGSSGSSTAVDTVTINNITYAENGTTLKVDAFQNQTNTNFNKYGGPFAVIAMTDTTTGGGLNFQILSTVDGWPGVYSLGTDTGASLYDNSVSTGGTMVNNANGSLTGGTITINAFGAVGQAVTGSFTFNLCDQNTTCSVSVKHYTGTFSISRSSNAGSLTRPVSMMTPTPTGITYSAGILPLTGKNYYSIPTNTSGGTLTITLTPTADVNLAVYTDAAFTTPATCDITSTLNVAGTGVETCAITVAASQKIYASVSQTTTATAFETYTLIVAE